MSTELNTDGKYIEQESYSTRSSSPLHLANLANLFFRPT